MKSIALDVPRWRSRASSSAAPEPRRRARPPWPAPTSSIVTALADRRHGSTTAIRSSHANAKADGRSIEANYRLAGDTTTGRVLHAAGAGNCRTVTWDKTEGANVQIRMCYREPHHRHDL